MTKPQSPSGAQSLYRRVVTVGLGIYWLLMATATHLPKIPTGFDTGVGDKIEHRVAYFLLGLGLGIVWSAWRGSLRWPVALGLLAVAALYGALDETTQPFFGRDCDLYDWFADLQGAVAGVSIAVIYDLATRRPFFGR